MAVKVGIGLFTGQVMPGTDRTFHREYREVLEMVRLAEKLGFDSAWVSEHHGAGDGYLPSLLPMLAAMAAVTERVRLGTGVMLTPFHDPLRLAEDAAVVDQLSVGRLILGLGLGWREEEFRMFGRPRGERLRRTTETIEVLRRAWTGERFSFEGSHYRYDRVLVTPRPFREEGVPIYIGGMTEQAIRRAGRIADGYIRTRSNSNTWREALSLAEDGERERLPPCVRVAARPDVAVGDPPGAPDRLFGHAPDVDRHALLAKWPRRHENPVVAIVASLERESLAGPCPPQDLDRLRRPAQALAAWPAEHPELLLPPPEPEPEDQAPHRELVDHRGVLGQAERIVERGEHDSRSQAHALGDRGHRGEHRQERRQVPVPGAVVLADPRGIEPELLGQPDHLEHLAVLAVERPVGPGHDLPGEQPNPHLHGHGRPRWPRSR